VSSRSDVFPSTNVGGVSERTTGIVGVQLRELRLFDDERGSFAETYRREWLPAGAREMVQSNLSRSRRGVLRGMHYHRGQADYWVVLEGRAFVGLLDLRAGSPTHGNRLEVEMDGEAPRGMYIPPGVAHGFAARTHLTLLYFVDAYYDAEAPDEHGIAWDDPGLGIGWPDPSPVVSDRDRSNAPLSAALAEPPEWVDRLAGRA
jgi:dTDP-4-dehydrorhamnose 3,5-epimerase